MKNFLTLFYLSLGFISFSQNSISKQHAKEDISFFIDQAEQIHPQLYFKISSSDFNQKATHLLNQIKDSIKVNDFSKKLRAIANLLGDGHTNINFTNDLRDAYINQKTRLPFKVSISNKTFTVKSCQTDKLEQNDEIISINGINHKQLFELIKYPVADIDAFKIKLLEKYFSYYFFVEYGFTDSLDLQIKRNNEPKTVSIQLLKKSNNSEQKKYSLSYLNDSVAVLKINTFGGLNHKKYTTFLNESFDEIQSKSITHLLIDLTENGGGNSGYGEMIYPYLNISKVKYHQLYQIKTSKPEKKSIRKRFVKWYMYPLYPFGAFTKMGRILLYKKNGSITELNTGESSFKVKDNAFKGTVNVITSNSTYSAAADFVVGFRYAKRGKIIGDTLGQPYSGYIDKIEFELPNSKISAGVSFKKYEYVGTNNSNKFKGIEPDIFLDIDSFKNKEKLYQYIIQSRR